MRKQQLIIIGSILLCTACAKKETDSSEADTSSTAIKVVQPVAASDIDKIIGIGKVEPEIDIVEIKPEVTGLLQDIYVKEGAIIKKGTLIATIDDAREQAQLNKIKAQISSQQTGDATTRSEIARLRINADNQKRSYERLLQAYQGNAENKQNVDNAENAWQLSLQDIRRLETQLDNSAARIQELKADMQLIQVDVNKRRIVASSSGTILKLDVSPGALVNSSVKLGDFAPSSAINVITEVDELFANRVSLGQTATILQQGSTDTLATGTIISVAPNLKQKGLFSDEIGKLEDRRVREVRIRIQEPSRKQLLLGARVDCVIGL